MAGNRYRQAVRATGLSHRANGFWRADLPGDIGVAGRAADGNVPQGLPDPLLKRRATHVQRQVQAQRRGLDETHNPGDQLLEVLIGTDQIGPPELVLQIADQLLRIVPQQNGANPAFTLRHQNRAQGTLADGKPNVVVLAGRAIIRRFHAQQLIRCFIKTAVGVEAGVVQRVGHRTAIRQTLPNPAGTMGCGVAPGCQAGDSLEHTMKVKTAQSRCFGQFVQGRERFRAFDLPASGGHGGGMLRGHGALILRRAFARTITRCLCLFGRVEELDILRFRQARQATGIAVDAGGFHGIDKLPIGVWVASDDGGPAWVEFSGVFCRMACHGGKSVDLFTAD